jgi:hypothetical protein
MHQGRHCNGPPVTDFTETLVIVYQYVVQEDFIEFCFPRDLPQRPNFYSLRLQINKKAGQSSVLWNRRIGSCQQQSPLSNVGE